MYRLRKLPLIATVLWMVSSVAAGEQPWWLQPHRMLQTNLREIDADMDLDQYVRDVKHFGADVVLFNVGGIVANYPTELEFHWRNTHMEGDLVGEAVRRLHDENIRVIGRFDFSKINEVFARQHPEWLYVSEKGRHVNYNGQVHTCPSGAYQQEYMFKILGEAVDRYPLDGVFFNMIGYRTRDYSGNYHGLCQCENCKRRFKEFSAMELPKRADGKDPAYRKYQQFCSEMTRDLFLRVQAFLKKKRPALAICTYTDAGVDVIRSESNSALGSGTYHDTQKIKLRLPTNGRQQLANASVHFFAIPFRHAAVAPGLTVRRLWQEMVNGAWLDFYCIGPLARQEDRTGLDEAAALFRFHARNEAYLKQTRSAADVGLLSQGGEEFDGLFHILCENQVAFDFVDLEPGSLVPYSAVIVPDAGSLSGPQCTALDEYVKGGGKLLLTGAVPSALACLGEVPLVETRGAEPGSYVRIRREDKARLKKTPLEKLDVVFLKGPFGVYKASGKTEGLLRLIPGDMFGPPEKCYYRNVSDHPALLFNECGKGAAACFTFAIGFHYERQCHQGHAALVMGALDGLLEANRKLRVSASPLVEVTHRKDVDGRFEWVALFNHTGHRGKAIHPPTPIHHVELDIQPGNRVKSVRLLSDGRELRFKVDQHGRVLIAVPTLNNYEIVLLEYAEARTVRLEYDRKSPQLHFAAREIEAALTEIGAEDVTVELKVDPKLGLKPEGYSLQAAGLAFEVTAPDPAGAMYGGLHLAEAVRQHRRLGAIHSVTKEPFIARRGIKFNIPLDARTPSYDDTGDAAQKNIAEMWSFDFWQEFLDAMARHRYNTLTLWNPHPFPSIVKCPSYPDCALEDVCVPTIKPVSQPGAWREPQFVAPQVLENNEVVRRMSMDEKIAFWRRVLGHARDRNIDVYWITWNVLVNSAEGKYGITAAQDNPKTIAYLRECTRETLLTYPQLTGIGVTAGEHMRDRNDEFDREKFLWAAYGEGVMDVRKQQPDREVRFIHRVWQSGMDKIMRDFGEKYDGPFEVGFKYARARLYSSTMPPFSRDLVNELKRHNLRCWWNLRNDDIFNLRWGDPDYVRAFLENLPEESVTAGYHMGSDGYVWAREHTSTEPESPRRLEIDKHWYNFMLWGRLGYDPTLDRQFFERAIAERMPAADAGRLYDAWQAASQIIPAVNRFHWRNWDFMWAVEICSDNRRFHTVEDFIKVGPMEGTDLLSTQDYVRKRLNGETMSGTTPEQVADGLDRLASAAEQAIAEMPVNPAAGKELRGTLADIQAMAHLGRYYAAKIRGAVALETYRRGKEQAHRTAAVRHLEQAATHWQRYATLMSRQYTPQLLARTRRTDWTILTDEVKRDVAIACR